MDNEEKRATRERHERYLKTHHRTHDEKKRLRNEAKARKAGRKPKRHRRADDDTQFEKIAATPRAKRPAAAVRELPPSPLDMPATAQRALVVAVHRTHVRLRPSTGEGEVDARRSEPLVVGDGVWFDGKGSGAAVVARAPRRTELSRGEAGGRRVLAANVDLGVIVTSLRRPGPRTGLVDRVRVALAAGGIESVAVLSKVDLLTPAERTGLPAELARLDLADPAPLRTSAETGEGLDELRERLRGRTAVLVGHSGVGKSSLLNALRPGTDQAVAAGRAFDGKGRHTTSASSLFDLENGTRLIDTPGIRSFALQELDPTDLAATFPDIADLATRCRYRDCGHASEPDCAVRAALDAGALGQTRWVRYRRLIEPPGAGE